MQIFINVALNGVYLEIFAILKKSRKKPVEVANIQSRLKMLNGIVIKPKRNYLTKNNRKPVRDIPLSKTIEEEKTKKD